MKELNPQYRQNIVNGTTKPSALRLPASLITKFIDHEDSILAYTSPVMLNKRVEVEVNEDVAEVSSPRKSKSSLKKSRGKRSRDRRSRRGKSVTVRSGDTLSEIAERNHTTVKKLKKLNKISGNTIRAGKKLKVK